jgi:hypothetical protein
MSFLHMYLFLPWYFQIVWRKRHKRLSCS